MSNARNTQLDTTRLILTTSQYQTISIALFHRDAEVDIRAERKFRTGRIREQKFPL